MFTSYTEVPVLAVGVVMEMSPTQTIIHGAMYAILSLLLIVLITWEDPPDGLA